MSDSDPSAPCRHVGTCGGCVFQSLPYERHLAAKVEATRLAFEKAGVRAELSPRAAAVRAYYRNKMDYIVGPGPVVGLRERGRWDAIVDVRPCHLLSESAQGLVDAFRDFVGARGLEPYDLRVERGLVRYLVIREGKRTGQRLAIVVAHGAAFPFADFAALGRAHGCTAAALAVNSTRSDVSSGEIVEFAGEPLVERVGRFSFELAPFAFFQPNTAVAEELVELVGALVGGQCGGCPPAAGAHRSGTLLDLYCGVGLFSVSLHEQFARVIGVESASPGARGAARNAARAGAANVEIVEGTVERELARLDGETAIVDPPRSGLAPQVIQSIVSSSIRTLAYVSCNPATMARDIASLDRAFRLDSPVHLFDALPWTAHLEAVARLVRV